MPASKRNIYTYCYNNKFLFRLGYVRHFSAHSPMRTHVHDNCIEIVYQERGIQNYQVLDQNYLVHQGDVFFTRPHEYHNTGTSIQEVSTLYYIIFDPTHLNEIQLFINPEEYSQFIDIFAENRPRIFKAASSLSSELKNLRRCLEHCDNHYDTRIRNALSQVLLSLSAPALSDNSTQYHVEKCIQYIDTNLEQNLSVPFLASQMDISLSAFNKYFVKIVGIPPAEYVLKKKIDRIRELLISTDLPIAELAYQYGFSSSQYFATVFKRYCNMTPTQYRRIHQSLS